MTPVSSWLLVLTLVALAAILVALWRQLERWIGEAVSEGEPCESEALMPVPLVGDVRASSSPSPTAYLLHGQPIHLEHHGVTYPCRDWAEAIEVGRVLALIDRLPETEQVA